MRSLILGAALLLAACASDEAVAPAAAPAPPPPFAESAPAPAPNATMAAPGVTLPPEPPPPPARDGELVVPGQRERPVEPVAADPRTNAERMRDIRAWDDCVMRAQGSAETDPSRPQLTTPEEVCANSLRMSGRTAVPDRRR